MSNARKRANGERPDEPDLYAGVGARMRVVRDIFEENEPLYHGMEQWARQLGVSTSALFRYETGEQRPSVELLTRFAYYSGASLDFLVWGVLSPYMNRWLAGALRRKFAGRFWEPNDFALYRVAQAKDLSEHPAPRKKRYPAIPPEIVAQRLGRRKTGRHRK